jgi:cbb3-type cytochrome oxidase subunit 3
MRLPTESAVVVIERRQRPKGEKDDAKSENPQEAAEPQPKNARRPTRKQGRNRDTDPSGLDARRPTKKFEPPTNSGSQFGQSAELTSGEQGKEISPAVVDETYVPNSVPKSVASDVKNASNSSSQTAIIAFVLLTIILLIGVGVFMYRKRRQMKAAFAEKFVLPTKNLNPAPIDKELNQTPSDDDIQAPVLIHQPQKFYSTMFSIFTANQPDRSTMYTLEETETIRDSSAAAPAEPAVVNNAADVVCNHEVAVMNEVYDVTQGAAVINRDSEAVSAMSWSDLSIPALGKGDAQGSTPMKKMDIRKSRLQPRESVASSMGTDSDE